MATIYNLFKFIEDKKPQYKLPFKVKLVYDPNSLTKKELNVKGNLNLRNTPIQSLPDNLKVGGYLILRDTPIQSLPNDLKVGRSLYLTKTPIQSLPNGLEVGGILDLDNCKNLESLPNDLDVRGSLWLKNTPLSENYTEEEIKAMVPGVKGNIYLK